MQDLQQKFLDLVQVNKGIALKVIHLYADNAVDRQDLYQEILLQAWKAYPRFLGKSKFSTWLYKVSLNTALTYRRSVAREGPKRDLEESDAVIHPEPRQNQKQQLLWAIRQLPEANRMIVLLHLEGYGNEEIAEVTGLKTNHVGVKLHRIKQKLMTIIKEEERWT